MIRFPSESGEVNHSRILLLYCPDLKNVFSILQVFALISVNRQTNNWSLSGGLSREDWGARTVTSSVQCNWTLHAGTGRQSEPLSPAFPPLCPCHSLFYAPPLLSYSQVQPLTFRPPHWLHDRPIGWQKPYARALSARLGGACSRSRVSRALQWLAEGLQFGLLSAAVRRTSAGAMFRAAAPGQLRRAVSPGGEGRARWRPGLNLLFLWRSGRRSPPFPDLAGPRAGRPRLNWGLGSKFWGLPLPPSWSPAGGRGQSSEYRTYDPLPLRFLFAALFQSSSFPLCTAGPPGFPPWAESEHLRPRRIFTRGRKMSPAGMPSCKK